MDGIRGTTCLVTGGSGYLGRCICSALLAAGAAEVRSLDRAPPAPDAPLPDGVRAFTGDIRAPADVAKAMTGCSLVIHCASYGMSGRQMLERKLTRQVNVNGTLVVLAAASKLGVTRLVYTSTYNAVFGDKPIVNGDETLPLFPPSRHADEYSCTKALAERAVLQANCDALGTCAIRPAAIYGPGEMRHFPRIARLAAAGAVCFSIGPPSTRVDWVHGESVAFAHVLAAAKLVPGGAARGQAYFISDDQPVNQTEFLRPLLTALGCRTPRIWIPVWLMHLLAYLIESFCVISWKLTGYLPPPLLLPAEVLKVGVTHYFSIAKARRELGYEPRVDPEQGMRDTVAALMAMRARQAGSSAQKTA
jgi:nucleoside-diphosphate-sugar epimerase